MTTWEELAGYRRVVARLYAAVRESELDPVATCRRFRAGRDKLFRTHPQSALSSEQKTHFTGLTYFEYDPAFRFVIPVDPKGAGSSSILEITLEEEGLLRIQRFGRIHFTHDGETGSLSLYWVLSYGGGIFLPFRDLTNGDETYGGGRYLLDTIKHADLGSEAGGLILDFNYAYNPSCAYNPRWSCPLPPVENRLPFRVPAGEKKYLKE